jgi:hypothetical protein
MEFQSLCGGITSLAGRGANVKVGKAGNPLNGFPAYALPHEGTVLAQCNLNSF